MAASESARLMYEEATHVSGNCFRCKGEVRWHPGITRGYYICPECGILLEQEITGYKCKPIISIERTDEKPTAYRGNHEVQLPGRSYFYIVVRDQKVQVSKGELERLRAMIGCILVSD